MAGSSLFTLPRSFYDDISSAFPNAEVSTVSARVTASGETASASVSGSVVSSEQGAQSAVSATAEAETDGAKLTATGDAAASGETVSTSVDLAASIEERDGKTVAVGSAISEAEAKTEEGDTATATVSTDAEATGADLVITTDQSPPGGEATETGAHPIAESSTYLEAVRIEAVELETLELPLGDEGIDGLWIVLDWS